MLKRLFLISKMAIMLTASNTIFATVFSERPEVIQFIQELTISDEAKTKAIHALSTLESSDEIIQKITTPYEAMPWDKYRKHLISEKRVADGIKFWQEHADILSAAEKTFGVPSSLIVAIIGVESSYGQNTGKYPVLQALATLAFDYPKRSAFFKSELKEYLLLTSEHGLDPLYFKGSYAGAIGMPQFISSSYRNFAVDFDNSGPIDLVNNVQQVIGSVANYFKVHGWQTGRPVAYPARAKSFDRNAIQVATAKDPKPVLSLDTLSKHGINPLAKKLDLKDEKLALLEFENGTKKEYWLGLHNFYVITRYNHSSNYAMAVYQLSQLLESLYKQQHAKK